jgi:hypothetical protein
VLALRSPLSLWGAMLSHPLDPLSARPDIYFGLLPSFDSTHFPVSSYEEKSKRNAHSQLIDFFFLFVMVLGLELLAFHLLVLCHWSYTSGLQAHLCSLFFQTWSCI